MTNRTLEYGTLEIFQLFKVFLVKGNLYDSKILNIYLEHREWQTALKSSLNMICLLLLASD